MAESRDTRRSRGRLGWDTWREKRAHPYANAAVARTTKQAHAHGGVAAIPSGPSLCEKLQRLDRPTDGAVLLDDGGRESGLWQWCSPNASRLAAERAPSVASISYGGFEVLPGDFAGSYFQLFAARRRDRSGGEQRRARSVDPDRNETNRRRSPL